MRRLLFLLILPCLLAWTVPASAKPALPDNEVTRLLAGTWEWEQPVGEGVVIAYKLTLAGDGTYAYTSWYRHNPGYQVTATGDWAYRDGWLTFLTRWSSTVDPTGLWIQQSPIMILDIGEGWVKTPGGTVRRQPG